MRKVSRLSFKGEPEALTVCVLDILDVELVPDGEHIRPAQVAAAVICGAKGGGEPSPQDAVCKMLYVYLVENESEVVEALRSTVAKCSKTEGACAPNHRKIRTTLANDLWCLPHSFGVFTASWNRNSASKVNKLLVSITEDMIACVWRVGPSTSHELLINIDIGENTFGPTVTACWMEFPHDFSDPPFDERSFIMFFETRTAFTATSHEERGCQTDVGRTGIKGLGKEGRCSGGSCGKGLREQIFKIFSLCGIQSSSNHPSADCVLGYRDMDLPMQLQKIKSVRLCAHTMENGLLTVYTTETMRPKKICTKTNFRASKWVTLISSCVNDDCENVCYEDLVGSQIMVGNRKLIPPCIIYAVNDIGLDVELMLTPCDIFLKDWNPKIGDKVLGLVARYMCHASTPLFIRKKQNNGAIVAQDVEQHIVEHYKSLEHVRDVVSFHDRECFVVFVLYRSGRMDVLRTCSNNPGYGCINELKINTVARINAVKVLSHNQKTLFMMFVVDIRGVSMCQIYNWDAASISLQSSWTFHPDLENERLILEFDLWYENGPMYLVSPSKFVESEHTDKDSINIYLINGQVMRHWLRIAGGTMQDLITEITKKLPFDTQETTYSLKGDKLLCKTSERVVQVPLVPAGDGRCYELPVYHPSYIRTFLDLGLRKLVDELICALVDVFRDFLGKLRDTSACKMNREYGNNCDCVIIKTEHIKMFLDFNRAFSSHLLRTFSGLISRDPYSLFGEALSLNMEVVKEHEKIPIKELIVFLQHIRLPGMLWREQIDLMDTLQEMCPKENTDMFFTTSSAGNKSSCGFDTASNFLLYSESRNSKEFEIDETLDFKITLDNDETEEKEEPRPMTTCSLVRRAENLLKRGSEEDAVLMHRTNDQLVSLTLPSKPFTDEFCLLRYLDYIKYDLGKEEYVVWAMLYSDDLNLFSSVLSMIDTGNDLQVCQCLLRNMQNLGLGYWIHSQACLEKLSSTMERGFRKLIATTEPGGNVEVFDEFGFWSILRNKPLVYGCVLNAKGFQRLGEFLSNDFSTEKWKQVAVKNAFALIGKKRYLLAAGFLVLANRIDDAVDVCFQYLKDPQIACLICKVRHHDLGYAVNLMQPSRIRDVLCYKLGMSSIVSLEVTTVDNLVYYLYTGIRFQYVQENVMIETVRNCVARYRGLGMPLVSLMLDGLIVDATNDEMKQLLTNATLMNMLSSDPRDINASLQEHMRIIRELCEQSIEKNLSSLSNFGSDIAIDTLISTMDYISEEDLEPSKEPDLVPDEPEVNTLNNMADDSFHIRMVNIIYSLKKQLGLDNSVSYCSERVSFDHKLFEACESHPDYFWQLCKHCVGFLEGDTPLDGNRLLALILQAIIQERNDLPSCLILSVASLLATSCFDRGVLGQIYDAFLGQLLMLNNLLNNQGSGDQFLTCLLRVVEPLCFGSPGKIMDVRCINLLMFLENSQKHAFFGMCIGNAIFEMLITLCRNWIYNFAENADHVIQYWIDRLIICASGFMFANLRSRVMEDALTLTGIVFPMLSLRVGLEKPVDCKVRDEECHVYDSFLERYVASLYGNEFEKLWRLLHCGFRTSHLFSRHYNENRSRTQHGNDICCNAFDLDRCGQAAPFSNRPLPLIIPLSCLFSTAQTWNGEYFAAQASFKQKGKWEPPNTCPGSSAVLETLRAKHLNASHTYKGRLLSTFYALPSTTSYNGLNGLTTKSIVGPVLNDLYMMVMLNLNSSGKLSHLSDVFTTTAVNQIYVSIINDSTPSSSSAIYVKLIKAISTYCRNRLDNVYQIRKISKLSRLTEKLLRRFRISDSKDQVMGGPSGGICGHPTIPVYAVVYGENPSDRLPAYNVTLEHSVILLKESQAMANQEGVYSNFNLVYDRFTGTHMNMGQGYVFGDLNSIGWSGESLFVFDKNGWLLVYYLKNMNYVSGAGADFAIPAVSFRAHNGGILANWISDTYVVTIGNGLLPESISPDVIVLDAKNGDIVSKSSSSSAVNQVPSGTCQDFVDTMNLPKQENDQIIRGVCEMQMPCVCIWDLIEFGKNNAPKLKLIIANGASMAHSIFNKKKQTALAAKFTCVLPIPAMASEEQPGSRIGHDLLLFDSQGLMMLFSEANEEITWTYKAHSCAVIRCFYVRYKVVTVGQDGSLGVFTLNGTHAEPTRIFDGVANISTKSQDSGSNSNIVTSIGEYLGIRFAETAAKDTPTSGSTSVPEILDAQIVRDQYLVLTTVDGSATVTELPY